MPEKEKRMVPVQVNLYCDACGTEMQSDGIMYPDDPPAYPHTCHKCGWKTTVLSCYPYIKYVAESEAPNA